MVYIIYYGKIYKLSKALKGMITEDIKYRALDIHVEGLNENNFENGDKIRIIQEILEKNIPVAFSFSPWQEPIWREANPIFFELAKFAVKREGSFLGQQGLNHKCIHNHRFADPWHENYCIWKGKINSLKQFEFMQRGRDILEKLFDKIPEFYAPPNHYCDRTTLEIANVIGYKFCADKAMIELKPYKFGNMLVVPEGNLEKGQIWGRAAIYIHYDRIDRSRENYNKILYNIISMDELEPDRVSYSKKKLNSIIKYSSKIARDIRRTARILVGKKK